MPCGARACCAQWRSSVMSSLPSSSKSPSCVQGTERTPYEDMLNLVDTLNELKDKKLLAEIERARTEYRQGKAVPAEKLFKKMGF